MKPNFDVTDHYDYANQEQEFVICHRNRPFAVLVSPHLPTPTTSFIDHLLVKELGLKLNDVSCKKLSFAGKKMRILGKVSFTAQCVKNGNIFGTIHFKGSVVEDLRHHFDCHAVAGAKMVSLLEGDTLSSSPSSSRSTSPMKASPKPTKPSTPPVRVNQPKMSNDVTPQTRKIFNFVAQMQKTVVKTPPPPGFPSTPQYGDEDQYSDEEKDDQLSPHHTSPFIPVVLHSTDGHRTSDPRSANIASLNAAFNNIDLEPDYRKERDRLLALLDQGGDVQYEDTGDLLYFTSTGFSYSGGHGREKCSQEDCLAFARDKGYIPNNCGMHKQWALPPEFQYCSIHCRGGYCKCLLRY